MDAPQDNPAGRLHSALAEIRNLSGNTHINNALANVLGLGEDEHEDEVVLHQYVAVMAAWPGTAVALVKSIPDQNHDLVLRWVPKVAQAMLWVGRWNQSISSMQNEYDHQTLYSLEVTADLLHRFKPEPVLEEDKLPSLIEVVRKVIDDVSNDTNLSAIARAFLLKHLIEVQNALLYFHVVGYSGVEDAMDRFLGATFRTPEVRDERARAWFARLWNAINTAMTRTTQISAGATSAMKAIETGKGLFS